MMKETLACHNYQFNFYNADEHSNDTTPVIMIRLKILAEMLRVGNKSCRCYSQKMQYCLSGGTVFKIRRVCIDNFNTPTYKALLKLT